MTYNVFGGTLNLAQAQCCSLRISGHLLALVINDRGDRF